ncbi:Abequosyltransferase RfbV [Sulfurospirillum diekertiae]|uniref:Abequosyltransferase RfbV n=1 Tax=Sulfurospirillum diekertiae TaxID=1854492 RepID=A0A1Y0HPG5_9BACT|nr:glycosyltransferase family 2 protein [Sulfurospirillum diekertiae]ARU49446.1 Abequosyltransferase RfbV [Sulfurospirillum diekertiae]
MIYNSLLSIVVPTYNRADFLDYCLEFHIPLAREYNIQIFISDNASTDNTREIVSKWMKEYPLLKYHQNASNVGPDRNFEIGLKLPDTEYIWLLGDTYQIPSNGIEYFLRLFPENNKYEVIICNVENRVLNIPSQRYKNPNKLLNDLGWHLTCLSSLIYSSRLVAQADFERYYNTSFIQTGIIFEYIAEKNFTIYWSDSISVMGINDTRLKKKRMDTRGVCF